MDQITVSDITRELIENDPCTKPQPAREAWARKLDLTHDEWKHVAKLYTHPLLKHTDKHLHFKHITHRRLGTRNRFAQRRPLQNVDSAGGTAKILRT